MGNTNATVSLLVVFQHSNQGTPYCQTRTIDRIQQLRLACFRVTPTRLHTSRLEIQKAGTR